jgi:hypothetical protein
MIGELNQAWRWKLLVALPAALTATDWLPLRNMLIHDAVSAWKDGYEFETDEWEEEDWQTEDRVRRDAGEWLERALLEAVYLNQAELLGSGRARSVRLTAFGKSQAELHGRRQHYSSVREMPTKKP